MTEDLPRLYGPMGSIGEHVVGELEYIPAELYGGATQREMVQSGWMAAMEKLDGCLAAP